MLHKFAFVARALHDRGRQSPLHRVILLRLMWVLAALAVHGCGDADPDYYPLASGRWWLYEVETRIRGESARHRLLIENLRSDGAALLQRRQSRLFSRLHAGPDGIAISHSHAGSNVEQLILPTVPRSGREWSVSSTLALVESRTFAAEDKLHGRALPLTLTARIAGQNSTIKTAAGSFDGCIEVELTGKRIVRIDRGNAYAEVSVTQREWYAPGVGLVKVSRIEHANSTFLRDGHYTQELMDYGK